MTDSIEFSLKNGIVWGNKVITSKLDLLGAEVKEEPPVLLFKPLLVVRERQ